MSQIFWEEMPSQRFSYCYCGSKEITLFIICDRSWMSWVKICLWQPDIAILFYFGHQLFEKWQKIVLCCCDELMDEEWSWFRHWQLTTETAEDTCSMRKNTFLEDWKNAMKNLGDKSSTFTEDTMSTLQRQPWETHGFSAWLRRMSRFYNANILCLFNLRHIMSNSLCRVCLCNGLVPSLLYCLCVMLGI